MFIIPSSTHEFIILTSTASDSRVCDVDKLILLRKEQAELTDMVCEVNEGRIFPEKRLSNQVYFYDRAKKEFSIKSKF